MNYKQFQQYMRLEYYPRVTHMHLVAKNCVATVEPVVHRVVAPIRKNRNRQAHMITRFAVKLFPHGLGGIDVPDFSHDSQFKDIHVAIQYVEAWLKDNGLFLGSFWKEVTPSEIDTGLRHKQFAYEMVRGIHDEQRSPSPTVY